LGQIRVAPNSRSQNVAKERVGERGPESLSDWMWNIGTINQSLANEKFQVGNELGFSGASGLIKSGEGRRRKGVCRDSIRIVHCNGKPSSPLLLSFQIRK